MVVRRSDGDGDGNDGDDDGDGGEDDGDGGFGGGATRRRGGDGEETLDNWPAMYEHRT